MIIRYNGFSKKYNAIISADDKRALMHFGVISLKNGDAYANAEQMERVFMLIEGDVTLEYQGINRRFKRGSFLDENPVCLHLPRGMGAAILAGGDSELVYQAVHNENDFAPKLYTQEDCVTEQFGKGVLNGTSLRHVRTVIDDSIAPWSNLVIGEVINFPGRWSSYPAHHHVQPEAYYYRFYPSQGFGFSCEGEDVYKVYDRDTLVVESGKVHPQVAAPGYAMYYVWAIPHAPKRWRRDREYLPKDIWMLQDGAIIWPDKE